MGLLDLQTDLKSLKFGVSPATDTPGGGNSGQPYITNPIDRNIVPQSEDFLLRGGLNAPLDAAKDVVRLTKFFGDLKSPRGVLFVAKQNLLSRTGVATQASGIKEWQNAALNEGLYTPLSTLAQAGINFDGGHIPKQGAIPIKGVRTYSDVVKGDGIIDNSIVQIDKNRLVTLLNEKQLISPTNNVNIYSYSGGPGSSLGIGKTNIKFATDNLGAPLRTGINNPVPFSEGLKYNTRNLEDLPLPLGASTLFNTYTDPTITSFSTNAQFSNAEGISIDNGLTFSQNFKFSTYKFGTLESSEEVNTRQNTLVWTQQQIEDQTNPNEGGKIADPTIQDFRAPLLEGKTTSTVTSIAPSYNPGDNKTIEGKSDSRVHMKSPGQIANKNLINYTNGSGIGPIDKINALPIYTSKKGVWDNKPTNDLIQFRIAALDSKNPKIKEYIHFRAFIDSFNDSYSAQWDAINYMGRGDSFWKYSGFGRTISLSFTVAAQSKEELMIQYKKLNFLVSNLSPAYTSAGYMGGPLVSLTMGGWLYEQPGFITGLSLDVPKESPWEIGINTEGEKDNTVKELPHVVQVSGFGFTPIQKFRPEKQGLGYGKFKNKNDKDTSFRYSEEDYAEVIGYGKQRYIALENERGNNYDDESGISS